MRISDWSSDVCSSDLQLSSSILAETGGGITPGINSGHQVGHRPARQKRSRHHGGRWRGLDAETALARTPEHARNVAVKAIDGRAVGRKAPQPRPEIGRAHV